MKKFAAGDRVRLTRDVPCGLTHYVAGLTGEITNAHEHSIFAFVKLDNNDHVVVFHVDSLERIEPCPTRRAPPMIEKHVVNIFTVAQLHHGFGNITSFNRAAKLVIRTGKPHYFRDYDAALIKVVP
jgi:hypothetical protein